MLTGHSSGDLKLWQASQQGFHQPLAVIRAASRSPVQSLVILPNINLICSAHLEGCISLFVSPERSASYHLPSVQIDSSLPSLNLPGANFQAHKSGLRQCVAGDSGLVSLGAFGSIMLWPEAELKATLNSAGLQHPGRYSPCLSHPSLPKPPNPGRRHQHPSTQTLYHAWLERKRDTTQVQTTLKSNGFSVHVLQHCDASRIRH